MNNKRSPIEQFLLIALLGFAAFQLSQHFFGPQKNNAGGAARNAPTLDKAFADLKTKSIGKDAALAEIAKLQKEVETNSKDDYAAWAHLRVGLLKQYVLKNAGEARDQYDLVINRHQNKPTDAQALYQKGDLLWRQSRQSKVAAGSTPSASTTPGAPQTATLEADAASALEQIPIRARSDKSFLETKIFVPDAASFQSDPLDLPQSWEQVALASLKGDANSSDPRGILARVDAHYSTTPLYTIFDTVVKWFGAQPGYSYGLALLLLAVVTRTLMQPFIKKQYDSMKGMSVIAPEMKKIQERYKGKTDQAAQMKMMAEIRALQKAHGVNPMGCGISMLIQMPVFFFFVLPLINHYQAKLELAGAHFGWVASLARPDIPLLVLYAISMFISVRLSSVPPTDDQQKMMQRMTTFMSPLFALVLWSYPSAFILYWLTYNVVSMFFQWRMMKKAEPEKNLVKTLMGTGQPVLAVAGAGGALVESTPEAGGALPARPKSQNKSDNGEALKTRPLKALENESPFDPDGGAQNGNSRNGSSGNGKSQNGAAKSGGGSQRARRRRR